MATAQQKAKVARVMGEKKRGTLQSSCGRKVTSRKQAIAIALSDSGLSRNQKKAIRLRLNHRPYIKAR